MTAKAGAGRPVFAVCFVACLHLLTLPGTWLGTDQGEMVLAAHRLVGRGTLSLADDGRLPVPDAPWAARRAGEPVRSRLHPVTPVLLAPLVLLDRALGFRDPLRDGHLIYLQGLGFVAAALGLLGFFLRSMDVPESDASLTILFIGTSFPLWTASRAGGAEPILALALIGYAGASEVAFQLELPRRFLALRLACLLLLPWIHPIGFALAPLLAAAELLRRGPRHATAPIVAAGLLASLGFGLLWNYGYHGQLLAGGYGTAGGFRFFNANPLYGAWTLLRDLLRDAPFALALPLLAAIRGGRARSAWWLPAIAIAAIVALFASLYDREAWRRFAPVIPLLGLPLGLGWSRLDWPLERAGLVAFASIAWGIQRLLAITGAYYPGPDGLFYPAIVWVKLALDEGWSLSWALPVAALVFALAGLWRRVFPADRSSAATERSADR